MMFPALAVRNDNVDVRLSTRNTSGVPGGVASAHASAPVAARTSSLAMNGVSRSHVTTAPASIKPASTTDAARARFRPRRASRG